MPIHSSDKSVQEILGAFGAPKNCVKFTLEFEVDELVTVTCVYYPEPFAEEIVTLAKRYRLVEITDE